jgi:hypothetical protein
MGRASPAWSEHREPERAGSVIGLRRDSEVRTRTAQGVRALPALVHRVVTFNRLCSEGHCEQCEGSRRETRERSFTHDDNGGGMPGDMRRWQIARTTVQWTSGTNILAGLWLILAPFALEYNVGDATGNDIVIGASIALLATIRVAAPLQFGDQLDELRACWMLINRALRPRLLRHHQRGLQRRDSWASSWSHLPRGGRLPAASTRRRRATTVERPADRNPPITRGTAGPVATPPCRRFFLTQARRLVEGPAEARVARRSPCR